MLDFGVLGVQGVGCRVQGLRGLRTVVPDMNAHSGERATHQRRSQVTFGTDIGYTSVENAGEFVNFNKFVNFAR